MRRGLAAIVLLACSEPAATTVASDASAPEVRPGPSDLVLSIDRARLTIVRGQSADIVVSVATLIQNHPAAKIGFAPLPLGLSGTSVDWNGQSAVTVTLTAASDAPNVDMVIAVRASGDGAVLGEVPIHVAISSVEGSLDTTFGQDGYAQIEPGEGPDLRHIEARADGGWTVTGVVTKQQTSTYTLIASLDASGAVQNVVTHAVSGFDAFSLYGASTNTDGRVALGIYGTNTFAIVVLDAMGAVTSVVPVPVAPLAVGWNGDQVVASQASSVIAIDSNQNITLIADTLHASSFRASVDGLYVTTYGPSALLRYAGGVLDSSFALDVSNTNESILGLAAFDTNGRLLVGGAGVNDGAILRVLPSGALDTTFGDQGACRVTVGLSGVTSILELPSHELLLVGVSLGNPGVAARFSANGLSEQAFGTSGQSRVPVEPTSAAIDAAADRACLADRAGVVYCLRLQ